MGHVRNQNHSRKDLQENEPLISTYDEEPEKPMTERPPNSNIPEGNALRRSDHKILLPGGAGLVGQNLVVRLKQQGLENIVVLDKHRENIEIMRTLHPDIVIEYADLAEPGSWEHHFEGASSCVILQAQIGASTWDPFVRNNIQSTKNVVEVIRRTRVPFTIHVSSSVVESVVRDNYTETKKAQEKIVLESGIPCVVLRPTLMFGWFDRKHLGWLSRFMKAVPVFPVPGNGRYMRQPLYVGDFCNIIVSCLIRQAPQGIYNISGVEKVDYIDIIRTIRTVIGAKTLILHIPVGLFSILLKVWASIDPNPPFTASQLKALTAKDEFEVIDWENLFGVKATPFGEAIRQTFTDPAYSQVTLKF